MQYLARIDPPPVEVDTKQTRSIVAIDDPIRVQHWYDLKDVVLAQDLGLAVVASQEFDDALHDEAGIALSRVDSGRDNNCFLLFVVVEVLRHLWAHLRVV